MLLFTLYHLHHILYGKGSLKQGTKRQSHWDKLACCKHSRRAFKQTSWDTISGVYQDSVIWCTIFCFPFFLHCPSKVRLMNACKKSVINQQGIISPNWIGHAGLDLISCSERRCPSAIPLRPANVPEKTCTCLIFNMVSSFIKLLKIIIYPLCHKAEHSKKNCPTKCSTNWKVPKIIILCHQLWPGLAIHTSFQRLWQYS